MFLLHEPKGCNETQSASSLDCGLFVSVYAEHISRNTTLAFDQIDMKYLLYVDTRLYLQVTTNLCGDIFHVKFQIDSESGLRSDLRGRASELRGWVQNHIKIT